MLPHSLPKNTIGVSKTSFMETGRGKDEDNIDDYFNNDTDVILEDEEEYDVLNDETFGEAIAVLPNYESTDLEPLPSWEEYDLHNDETFGEESISYDWEAEHEKLVSILEPKSEDKNECQQSSGVPRNKTDSVFESEVPNRNGYYKIDDLINISSYHLRRNEDGETVASKSNVAPKNKPTGPEVLVTRNHAEIYHNSFENDHEDFGSTETLTNENCHRILKRDKWYNNFENTSNNEDSEHNAGVYSQGYSLFSSGANLLQNAGIHIPSVTGVTSSTADSSENTEKRFESAQLQSSTSTIPNVSDLEKQWINDAASKSVITADCFRAYNSAFFVNSGSSMGSESSSMNNQFISPTKRTIDPFTGFRDNDANNPLVMQLQKMVYSTTMTNPNYLMNGESDLQSVFCSKLNLSNRPPPFDHKSYPVPIITDSGIVMCDNPMFRNPASFADMNARTVNAFVNSKSLNQAKDQSVIVSPETPTHAVENSLLVENSITNPNVPRLGISLFPPPGLSIDPSKLRHIQNAVALQAQHQRPTSHLTLPPPQVVNGIVTVERQKQLMKMQKECSLSQADQYAGMMTEREKYWLAGVQLLQINSMDPYKDDYYFTNYQARRKGNRNKNQNTNNSNWKNQHTKDYSPLQFENSLGRVQIGSVVAPRKVIDTYLIESSPKHGSKLGDMFLEDPIANTSSRKRKAIMLHIENMYGKIMALESLQVNSGKNKSDPATIKAEFESIVTGLREEILNLKDDFKIIMSIKKGKRLVLRFLSFCDNPTEVWYHIFEILDRIVRGDHEHCVLLSYLPYFRTWLTSAELNTLIHIASYFQRNLSFFLRDKFSVSVIANMIEHAEVIYFYSKSEEQNAWMEFIIMLAQHAHSSFDSVQKPVVSVKPQVLRSHLLKCKKLENGYMSYLLKIFSNNSRK